MGMGQGDAPGYDGVTSRAQLRAIIWRMRAETERIVAEAGPGRIERPGATGNGSLKETIAHLAAWRWWSVARLEGAARGEEPTPPWGDDLVEGDESSERDDTDRINARFADASRDRTVDEVLRDSRATFDRLEAAVLALPEADLFAPDRFPWLEGYPAAAIVTHAALHLYEDHAAELFAFLARTSAA